MNILFLSQGYKISDHPGYDDAFKKLKNENFINDFLNIPYLGFAQKYGWNAFYEKIIELHKIHNFDVIYFQNYHKKEKPSPRNCIKTLQKFYIPPIIITSSGDGFSDNWMQFDYPQDFKDASRLADITFSTQMGRAAEKMLTWGAKRIVYSPLGLCQVRARANKVDLSNHKFDFDIVFVGNNNKTRFFNPISKYWWGAKKRRELVEALSKRYGPKFGLFGKGWSNSSSQGAIPFEQQQETYRRGRVIVGGNPYSYSDYYSSNRVFFEIASGIPTVELLTPRFDKVLRNNEHCYFCKDVKEVINKCDLLLEMDQGELYTTSFKAAKYIEEKHTQYHRIKFQMDTIKKYIKNNKQLDVDLPFFLPEVDLEEEKKYAVKQNTVEILK